jgi:hypothetical protein
MDEEIQAKQTALAEVNRLKEVIKALETTTKAEVSKQVKSAHDALLDIVSDKETRLAGAIAGLDKRADKIEQGLEKVQASDIKQSGEIAENRASIGLIISTQDKIGRSVEEHEIRLNGKLTDGEKELSIESLRRAFEAVKATLDGSRGGVALQTIIDKFREVVAVVNFGKFVGAGTVASLVGVWLNVSQPKAVTTEVLMLQEQVKQLVSKSESQSKTIQDLQVNLAKVSK